ncbi:MAG: Asp-tRNA(Asn)/Glu-tRNA(Gln) amidotransferase subunit GatB [Methanomicrobiales archaeon]|nr:Asp-tRNA(Asn)/Glu-tRNA(Gln) amidotransferase subunit GatB [Methanomicrobiales archaeon]MDI6875147.1 Asp-tRNA(Asn)/Glu-tRNA(Gln) amidotransferase subunit GatB [Methanomicrobiales archaeon]
MQVIIGLEVHCQLNTATKLFCGCSTDYRDDQPNTHVCPICMGLPGALPLLNRRAVEYALRVAKALECEVLEESEFARKNYFYPDLPKGFQITQYDRPLAVRGHLEIEGEDGTEKSIRITRVHMEEDPGRLVHVGAADRPRYSLVDYNRSGVPLIEIVTEPDLRSPKEARRFLNVLRATLEYLGVFDPDREGSLRVDANVSLEGHERVEVKNISSYKGVEKALTYEITRQKNLIRRGQTVERETRHFQEGRGVTASARSKEMEHDYRYFPEPDLLPLHVRGWADGIVLPELPAARRARCMRQYGISANHARTLTGELSVADFYERVAHVDPLLAATWVADTLLGELNYRCIDIGILPPERFAELLMLLKSGTITDRAGVEVLRVMLDQGLQGREIEPPAAIVEQQGLAKAAGSAFADAVRDVIGENPQAVKDYRGGRKEAFNYLVGQVMKKTRGRADPKEIRELLKGTLQQGEVE